MSENLPVNIYADGACSGNQNDENTGGWGAVLTYGTHNKELYGGEINTTNNRMELTALISALEALNRQGLNINVFSDSSYVVNCMKQSWYKKWLVNGWRTSGKTAVENRDLWERLLEFLDDNTFSWYLIKGHLNTMASKQVLRKDYERFVKNNGDRFSYEDFIKIAEMNNRADELANIGISEARDR